MSASFAYGKVILSSTPSSPAPIVRTVFHNTKATEMSTADDFFALAQHGYTGRMTFFNSSDAALNNSNRVADVRRLEFVAHARHWAARLHVTGPRQAYEFEDILFLQEGTDTFMSQRVSAYWEDPDTESQIAIRCDGIEQVRHEGRDKLLVVGEWIDRYQKGSAHTGFHCLLDQYGLPMRSRLTDQELESLMRFKGARA